MQTQSVVAKSATRLERPTNDVVTEATKLPPLGTLLKIKRIRASDGDDDGGVGDTAMQGCTCTSYA